MTAIAFAQQPIITAIVDGDCTGGTPKLLEIYAQGTVDFSNFSIQNQTNTNTGDYGTPESLSGLGIVTDAFVYITSTKSTTTTAGMNNLAALASEFPSLNIDDILETNVLNVNGDDRVRIINAAGDIIDQYGVNDTNGDNEYWDYTDSYATRIDGTGPDASFTQANWSFAGRGALDGLGTCQGGSQTFEAIIGRI